MSASPCPLSSDSCQPLPGPSSGSRGRASSGRASPGWAPWVGAPPLPRVRSSLLLIRSATSAGRLEVGVDHVVVFRAALRGGLGGLLLLLALWRRVDLELLELLGQFPRLRLELVLVGFGVDGGLGGGHGLLQFALLLVRGAFGFVQRLLGLQAQSV